MQAEERVVARAFGVADFGDFVDAAGEAGTSILGEDSFFGAESEYDFVAITKRTSFRNPAGAGELEALVPEGYLSGREDGGLGFGKDGLDFFGGWCETFAGGSLVGGAD